MCFICRAGLGAQIAVFLRSRVLSHSYHFSFQHDSSLGVKDDKEKDEHEERAAVRSSHYSLSSIDITNDLLFSMRMSCPLDFLLLNVLFRCLIQETQQSIEDLTLKEEKEDQDRTKGRGTEIKETKLKVDYVIYIFKIFEQSCCQFFVFLPVLTLSLILSTS